jgi:hypothetical protein
VCRVALSLVVSISTFFLCASGDRPCNHRREPLLRRGLCRCRFGVISESTVASQRASLCSTLRSFSLSFFYLLLSFTNWSSISCPSAPPCAGLSCLSSLATPPPLAPPRLLGAGISTPHRGASLETRENHQVILLQLVVR